MFFTTSLGSFKCQVPSSKIQVKNTKQNKRIKMAKKILLKDYAGYLPLASLAAAAAGQVLMYCFKLAIPGLFFFAAAAAMLVISDRRGVKSPEIKISQKMETILFACIVLVAVFFRLALINGVPSGCFTDEAAIGLFTKSMLAKGVEKGSLLPVVLSGATYHPCLTVYPAAVVFRAFGAGITQLRIVSAIIGILAVPAFYFLIRYFMGPFMALCGAFLLAVMRWHVNFSRIGFDTILPVTLLILVLYFVIRAYRERKTADFALAGFTIAASQYTYVSARLVFAWLAICLVYVTAKDRKFLRENLKKIILMAAVMLVFLLPVVNYYLKWPENLLDRTKRVWLFNEALVNLTWEGKKTVPEVFTDAIIRTAGMFNVSGDNNGRHNLPGQPMLDFFTGMAALTGFLYALFYVKKPKYFFFVSYFAVFLIPGLITITAPHCLRTMNVIPAVLFFTLVFMNRIISGIRAKPAVMIAALACALLAAGAENAYLYFGPQAHSPECRKAFSQDDCVAAGYAEGLPQGAKMLVYDYFFNSDTFKFLAGDRLKDAAVFDRNRSIPLGPEIKTDIYMLLSAELMPFVQVMKQMYPGTESRRDTDPYTGGEYGFMAVKIKKGDIEKWNEQAGRHGLTGKYYAGNDWQGRPSLVEKKQLIAYEWNYQPEPPPSSAEWTGKIGISLPGEYRFILQARDYSALYIDGREILENEGPGKPGYKTKAQQGAISLKAGMHSIKIRHRITREYNRLMLWWVAPGETEKTLVPPGVLYY
jgi:4-amino-4-deoxy-L-arabinose transferase-like glycosyltransferase